MKRTLLLAATLLLPYCLPAADEVSTFPAYVDSDICARLMLGPITPVRMQCSKSTSKDGDMPVLVRLSNNMVFTANKEKTIQPLVGQLASITGEIKPKNGTIKIQSATPITADSLAANDPARRLVDPSKFTTQRDAALYEKIRHELAMMPYITEFDFISFTLSGGNVVLTGWTIRQTNRSTANNAVRDIPGVESVVNNIDVLPLGATDMQIRAGARAALQRQLSRYFWGNGSDIKIVVKNGQILLLGTVTRQADSDLATIQCNSVRGAFKVFNMLRVQSSEKKG